MSQKGIGSKMKVRAKDFALLAVIFAGLVMMEVVFRGATIGFEATDYLFYGNSFDNIDVAVMLHP